MFALPRPRVSRWVTTLALPSAVLPLATAVLN
jgi:hypothetical protein